MSSGAGISLDALPRRPRVAPGRIALWRSPESLQWGLDDEAAMVLDGLTPPLARLLRRMDGVRTTQQLLSEVEQLGEDPTTAAAMLQELCQAGLVHDTDRDGLTRHVGRADLGEHRASVEDWALRAGLGVRELFRRIRTSTVRVVGVGRLVADTATALGAAGVGSVTVDQATGTVRPEDVGDGYLASDIGRRYDHATDDAIRRVAPEANMDASDQTRPDLVVLAGPIVPDPALAVELVAERRPHLLVGAGEGRALLGPLVLPGRTACLRCMELAKRDRDAAWSTLAAQLVGRALPVDSACGHVAVGLAVQQALMALIGQDSSLRSPPTLSTTLQVDPVSGTVRRHRWAPHPRCGCGAITDRTAALPDSGTISG